MKKRHIHIWMEDPHDEFDLFDRRRMEHRIKEVVEDFNFKNIDMEFYDDEDDK